MTQRREFIRQLGFGAASIAALTWLPGGSVEALYAAPMKVSPLPRGFPDREGVSSTGIMSFLDAVEKSKIEFHSVMIVRRGKVIAEGWWNPYNATLKHTLYSLSKSFTSTAVGLAVSEGKLKLDAKVVSFFPGELPSEVSANLAAMTVKDLLTMSTGHAKDTIQPMRTNTTGESWAKIFLSMPVEHQPGTHFLYNTGATYMQSAIVQKATGQNVLEYLKPRLFEPLGIEGMDWEMDPKGIIVGGYGLRVKTEDIAKFGLLFLQKGKWNGKQIVPAEWIEQATSKQVENAPATPTRPNEENDWAQGYGFQFWRCTHNAVRGDGAFGQFCIMLPEHEMVVAITGESFDLQGSMKLVWEHLLPAITNEVKQDKINQPLLEKKLKSLAIPPLSGTPAKIWGNIAGKIFALDPNAYKARSASLTFTEKYDNCVVAIQGERDAVSFNCGLGSWAINKDFRTLQIFPIEGRPDLPTPVAASGAWIDEKSFVVNVRYTETAHSDYITFTFEDKSNLKITFLNSVSKGNPNTAEKREALIGKRPA